MEQLGGSLTFRALERELEIVSDSAGVLAFADRVYRHARVAMPSGAPRDLATVCEQGVTRGVTFNGERLPLEADEPYISPAHFSFRACNRVFRQSFARSTNWLSIYGAALRIGDRGIVFVSASGYGKTTLCLNLLGHGARFYSDEFVFVRRSDRYVSGFPVRPLIREASLARIANPRLTALCEQLPPDLIAPERRSWSNIDITDAFGDDILAEPAPLGALVILSDEGPRDRLARIPASLGAIELALRVDSERTGLQRVADVAEALGDVPAYRLQLGELDAAARAILEAFA